MNKNIENLWVILSDLFIDNEIDYEHIAQQLSIYSIDVIEFHLFYHVAPICSHNLDQIIPEIWTAFDSEKLIHDIYQYGITTPQKTSIKQKISAKLYHLKYKQDWQILVQHISKIKQQNNQ